MHDERHQSFFSLEVGNYFLPGVYLCPYLYKWGKLVLLLGHVQECTLFPTKRELDRFMNEKRTYYMIGHERDVNVIEWSFHISST